MATPPTHSDTMELRQAQSWALAFCFASPASARAAEVELWVGDSYRPEILRFVDQLCSELGEGATAGARLARGRTREGC